MAATPITPSAQDPDGSESAPGDTEVTPQQLRSMPFDDLIKLLDEEGIEVPDAVDITSQDAIVDWVVSTYGT